MKKSKPLSSILGFANQQKFDALRSFQLPICKFVITGSGPLGIRDLREIRDIDLLVAPELFEVLAAKFGTTDHNDEKKIVFPGGLIEAFNESGLATRLAKADILGGLPFDSLDNILEYKAKRKGEKDLKDIALIEAWKNS